MKRLLLLASLLWSASAFADGLPTTPYIYVQGSAEERVDPDTLTISFNVSVTDNDQAKAKAAVSEQSAAIFKLFKELGIANEALTAFDISASAKYDYVDRKSTFVGFVVTRNFTVRLTDFTRYPKLVDGLFDLRISSLEGTKPSYSKATDEEAKLKSAALADARKQAEEIAASLNAKVSSVFAASPVAFGQLRGHIFGSDSYDAVGQGFFGRGAGDTYVFEKLTLSQRLHVIFLIEPNKK